jgi:hypothetical protein
MGAKHRLRLSGPLARAIRAISNSRSYDADGVLVSRLDKQSSNTQWQEAAGEREQAVRGRVLDDLQAR